MKNTLGQQIVGILFVTLAGCCNSQPRPIFQSQPVAPPSPRPVLPVSPAPAPPPGVFQGAPSVVLASPSLPPPSPPPASPIPTTPPAGPTIPGGASLPPKDAIARVENRWQPSDSGIQLGAPEPATNPEPKDTPRLYPPAKTEEPPVNKSATNLPVGIPQFATAMDDIAAGLRPSLDDGLDWLQARGFKTVVQIRLPGQNDGTDRKQVDKRGMKYLSLEVSPQSLTKETVEEFSRIVGDASAKPLFIYDRDGSLAGGLWYLHFRMVLQLSDDVARVRAGALGLRENSGGHRDMWLAIQKYLNDSDSK
jgi:protein tyrosine phosphatase (PTP) superfamily phosphohydrolase (DUF442 family)